MFNMEYKRRIIYIAIILIVLGLVLSLLISATRVGKTKVYVETLPSDASLTINGKDSESGDLYLKPGTYTFIAKKSGFSDDKQVIEVGDTELSIGLIPSPNSKEAEKWLKDNPDIQVRIEEIAGKMSIIRGEQVIKETPVISSLPYTSIEGPFSIDYGADKSRQYGSFLVVSDSTPVGREAALEWIRDQGYDPTDFVIKFDDFVNPLSSGGVEQ